MFRSHLDKEKIPYTDADIAANLDWIKREIKKEVFISVFGLPAGYQVELEDDPQVAEGHRIPAASPRALRKCPKNHRAARQRTSGPTPGPAPNPALTGIRATA